ncbi:MAG TPA: VanZ family protein [Anaerolineales bacterium]|nr:VanZ family protein [Anaerolineales bacterium]
MVKTWIARWGMAALMMVTIFIFSSRPSIELPDFGSWDYFVKKGGHMLGYALLALTYWRGLNPEPGKKRFAWALTICYAITDEIHQGFVPGRHPSPFDIFFFDNLGAILGLVLWEPMHAVMRRRQA